MVATTKTTHNPFNETHRVSCLRENLTSSSDGEGLETGCALSSVPRQSLTRQITFEEGRRHLGLETQRQWSDKAIARTTPVLLGLFSLVCLMAHRLLDVLRLPLQATAWYLKQEATFSDALAFVRHAIWAGNYLDYSSSHPDQIIFHRTEWEILLDQLASTG
jgi:hypothetical protein